MVKGEADDKTPLLAEQGEVKCDIEVEEAGVRQRLPEGARKRGKEALDHQVPEKGKELGKVRRVPGIPPDPWWVTTLEVKGPKLDYSQRSLEKNASN